MMATCHRCLIERQCRTWNLGLGACLFLLWCEKLELNMENNTGRRRLVMNLAGFFNTKREMGAPNFLFLAPT
jgi:hypothetical protein